MIFCTSKNIMHLLNKNVIPLLNSKHHLVFFLVTVISNTKVFYLIWNPLFFPSVIPINLKRYKLMSPFQTCQILKQTDSAIVIYRDKRVLILILILIRTYEWESQFLIYADERVELVTVIEPYVFYA